MSDPTAIRPFLRLVVTCALVANAVAALVVQGERDLRPFRVAVFLDQDRLDLTEELGAYGAAVDRLHAHTPQDARP